MLTVAYLANRYPAASEPYVGDEIRELRGRGVTVVPCTARRTNTECLHILPIQFGQFLKTIAFCLVRLSVLGNLLNELVREEESWPRRFRALGHTVLGAYYAVLLREHDVDHIHVHHGYFSSWIAMVAARLLGISFSMTLHGSDLLVHHTFLDLKLRRCKFCLTVSNFNRQHLLATYPEISPDKIRVQHLGVELTAAPHPDEGGSCDSQFIVLSVGRLHRVKDHAFLLRACAELRRRGLWLLCLIAGDGPERGALEKLARELDLNSSVVFLGHVPHERLEAYYSIADMVTLTSRSEGIPLVLMEAMALARIVLAPAITGIPELVVDRQTGFLYRPGDLEDFVERAEDICRSRSDLHAIRRRARRHVLEHFNRERNLAEFAELFPRLVSGTSEIPDANLVLQQI